MAVAGAKAGDFGLMTNRFRNSWTVTTNISEPFLTWSRPKVKWIGNKKWQNQLIHSLSGWAVRDTINSWLGSVWFALCHNFFPLRCAFIAITHDLWCLGFDNWICFIALSMRPFFALNRLKDERSIIAVINYCCLIEVKLLMSATFQCFYSPSRPISTKWFISRSNSKELLE